jgi:hypothetical protein
MKKKMVSLLYLFVLFTKIKKICSSFEHFYLYNAPESPLSQPTNIGLSFSANLAKIKNKEEEYTAVSGFWTANGQIFLLGWVTSL